MRTAIRGGMACLLVLVSLTATPLTVPETAVALDQTITTCDWATFKATLDAVQADGGGTITFDCSGTIMVAETVDITTDVTIIGNDQVAFDGSGQRSVFDVDNAGRLGLIDLTVQNAKGFAAITNFGTLDVNGSTFRDNHGQDGGAIHNGQGDVTIVDSIFMNNSVETLPSGLPVRGAAISSLIGTLTIVASTFAGNGGIAVNGVGVEGGAIYTLTNETIIAASTFVNNRASYGGALMLNGGDTTITASTFTGNVAGGSDMNPGGAIYQVRGSATITASTFIGNQADLGGGIQSVSSATTTISGSIVALNTASSGASNCAGNGTYISEGSNLSDNADCGFSTLAGDIINSGNINLDALDDYGGATMTMPPMAGSDAIDNAGCEDSSDLDQRGAARPVGASCDIGAVEVGGVVPTTPVHFLSVLPLDDPVDEGQMVEILAAVHTPGGALMEYRFDCDGDQQFETPGDGQGPVGFGSCLMVDDDQPTVGVQACDASTPANCDTAVTTVNVVELAPLVAAPIVDPSPSNEGSSVTASAAFDAPDALDCTVDYGDGSGPLMGTLTAGVCTGPAHIYADGDNTYSVTVEVCDDDNDCASNSVEHSVANVAPTIDEIEATESVQQGEPVSVTVAASDPGILDVLMYSFDCDGDGTSYEVGPQLGDTADCALDPAAATTTINVLVEDGDGGSDTASTTVSQTATLCVSTYTGALSGPTSSGSCPQSMTSVSLPGANPTTVCINRYTNALTWSSSGACGPYTRPHIVPNGGPLSYCQSIWTNQLRYMSNGQCQAHETPGVIPGTDGASGSSPRR